MSRSTRGKTVTHSNALSSILLRTLRFFGRVPRALVEFTSRYCKMFEIKFLSLLYMCTVTVSVFIENDTGELVSEVSINASYSVPPNAKSARFFSHVQNPIIDYVMNTASGSYEFITNKPGDLFDFLRDPYPLPDGE